MPLSLKVFNKPRETRKTRRQTAILARLRCCKGRQKRKTNKSGGDKRFLKACKQRVCKGKTKLKQNKSVPLPYKETLVIR